MDENPDGIFFRKKYISKGKIRDQEIAVAADYLIHAEAGIVGLPTERKLHHVGYIQAQRVESTRLPHVIDSSRREWIGSFVLMYSP